MKTIHQQLKDANIELDTHESDLYAKVTRKSEEIISRYEFKDNVKKFKSSIGDFYYFEIPFANDDYSRFNLIINCYKEGGLK